MFIAFVVTRFIVYHFRYIRKHLCRNIYIVVFAYVFLGVD